MKVTLAPGRHPGREVPETMADSSAGTTKLVGGDPCLDFVNTVGGRLTRDAAPGTSLVLDDKLGGYDDLLAWARHAELLSGAQVRRLAALAKRRPREAARVVSRARSTREALYRVLVSLMRAQRPASLDLATLNAEIATVRGREQLVLGTGGLQWAPDDSESRLDSVLWPVWRSAATLLTSEDALRLRQCGGEGCGWLFLDRSRNRSRRWCTMEDCGNVAKVRRFRLRRGARLPAGRVGS